MPGQVRRIGKFKKARTISDVLIFVGLAFLAWQALAYVLGELPSDLAQANGPQLIMSTILAVIIGGIVTYIRTGSTFPRGQRGVFLDGEEVVIRDALDETRIPLAEAVVEYREVEIDTGDFIDGEHQQTTPVLRIHGEDGGVGIHVEGMTPKNVRRYRDQLLLDLAEARWQLRLPDPGGRYGAA